MTSSSVASLLVAALAMLSRPCPRNTAAARLLLRRASSDTALSPAERDTCLDLAEALDGKAYGEGQPLAVAAPPQPITDWGAAHRQRVLREVRQWLGSNLRPDPLSR
jgi:hypothetical protein